MKNKQSTGGLVYSTEHGAMCPTCRQATASCSCGQDTLPTGDGIVRVSRESKGRKGKGVTLIKGILLRPSELLPLAKQLKARCGSGGTVKDGVIEIQGDHVDMLLEHLKSLGWVVKRTGG